MTRIRMRCNASRRGLSFSLIIKSSCWSLVYFCFVIICCLLRTVDSFSTPSFISTDFVQSTLAINSKLFPIQFAGTVTLSNDQGDPIECAVLSNYANPSSSPNTLVLPLEPNGIDSLQRLKAQQPINKLQLFLWNSVFINRDNGLFDNLPYTTWWMDPDWQARDAAGNVIDQKYHMGKRSLYDAFMGKDWYQTRLQTLKRDLLSKTQTSNTILEQRLAQLQLREVQMEMAQVASDLAILQQQQGNVEASPSLDSLRNKREQLQRQQEQLIKKLQVLGRPEQLLDWVLGEDDDIDTISNNNGFDDDTLNNHPFASPYHLLVSQLERHMKAKVVACLLEPTNMANTVLGGAILLERQTAVTQTTVMGETLSIPNPDETYGNDNVQGGDLLWVECDADEALCLSEVANVPLCMEEELWQKRQYAVQSIDSPTDNDEPTVFVDTTNATVLYTDQNASRYDTVLPLRRAAPSSLWDTLWRQTDADTKQPKSLFPTENPVQSLEQYDNMDDVDKVNTLRQLSNFNGRLPRPRAIQSNPQVLDDLLLPLIDETVRNQYLIRDAENRGDIETVKRLKANQSRRQTAKETAQKLREAGQDADAWDEEASFLESLRADATQDEGSYSRFLDRDDWYERNRQRTAKRVDKSKFGTLLDGLE